MRVRRWILPAVLVAAALGHTVDPAFSQSDEVTVSVTGSGLSVDEARTDAIRQALQLTMKQLIVVDRAISGDKVLRDRVMSTMNGYIDKFSQTKINRTSAGYSVSADVTVSASRIENFIGVVVGSGGEIPGHTLLAEQNRRAAQARVDQLQSEARGEIFDRVLRGFPTAAMELKISSIGLSDNDPNVINVAIAIKYKPTFVKALVNTVKTLAKFSCGSNTREFGYDLGLGFGGFGSALRVFSEDECLGRPCPTIDCIYARTVHDIVCLGFDDVRECYQLEPGEYCTKCRLEDFSSGEFDTSAKNILIFGRFTDESGQVAGNRCVTAKLDRIEAQVFFGRGSLTIEPNDERTETKTVFFGGIDFREGQANLKVASNDVDLNRAKYFVAVAALAAESNGGEHPVTNLVPDSGEPEQGGCEMLDEATQLFILSHADNKRASAKNDEPQTPVAGDQIELNKRAQAALTRLGCGPGVVNGKWGPRSQDAIRKFASSANVALAAEQPTADVVNLLEARKKPVCSPTPQ